MSNPTLKVKDLVVGVGALVLVVVLFISFGGDKADVKPVAAPVKTDQQIADDKVEKERLSVACRADLHCWGDKFIYDAGRQCTPEIERFAKHDVKWTNGFLEQKLSKYKWLDKKAGTLAYIGDKVQFQNGFGAYTNYIYRCDYDPTEKKVLNAKISEGRLGSE